MKRLCVLTALLLTLALCLASCNTAAVGISGAKLNENGELVLTLTDGTEQNVGKVTGENGTNGAKGDKGDTGATGAPGEAGADEEGMQTMRILARNMSFLIKSIALGKEAYGLPKKEDRLRTNFIR